MAPAHSRIQYRQIFIPVYHLIEETHSYMYQHVQKFPENIFKFMGGLLKSVNYFLRRTVHRACWLPNIKNGNYFKWDIYDLLFYRDRTVVTSVTLSSNFLGTNSLCSQWNKYENIWQIYSACEQPIEGENEIKLSLILSWLIDLSLKFKYNIGFPWGGYKKYCHIEFQYFLVSEEKGKSSNYYF